MYPVYPQVLRSQALSDAGIVIAGSKRCKTSSVELVFRTRVASYGLSDYIRADLRISIDGHHYEPDLAFIDAAHSIYIDIEVDEPYAAYSGPTHYLRADGRSVDADRNARFLSAGWHVVRFSERQMFSETEACIRLVLDLARQMGAAVEIPQALAQAASPSEEPCWDRQRASEWKRGRYRQQYLRMPPTHFYWRCVPRYLELGMPILGQSILQKDVRREMLRSLSFLLQRTK